MGVLVEVGIRKWEIHPDELRGILDVAPREDFKLLAELLLQYIKKEAGQHPGGRFGLIRRCLPLERVLAWGLV